MHQWINHDLDSLIKALHIKDPQLANRFVLDDENPDFIIASEWCLLNRDCYKQFKHYLSQRKDSIFIFMSGECIDPDLNIFDYAVIWNRDLICGDRIAHNIPYVCNGDYGYDAINPHTFSITREEASKILEGTNKFCNFIYSHSSEPRDTFFHLLSQYKRVDALGSRLNNTSTKSTRIAHNWYDLSVALKSGYKFSIAMENATYRGYTTEKIVSSLQAHTVPIYWGNPCVSEFFNPKAFVNCHDYSSFEEVVERVKEIDNNDDLWLDMVTSPWQTEEQYRRTVEIVTEYESFMHNIFSQDIHSARRRPVGTWGDVYKKNFIGLIGVLPPLYLRAFRGLRRLIWKLIPKGLKPTIMKLLRRN